MSESSELDSSQKAYNKIGERWAKRILAAVILKKIEESEGGWDK